MTDFYRRRGARATHHLPLLTFHFLLLLALALTACTVFPTPNPVPPTFVPPALPTASPGSLARVTRGSITRTIAARGRVASVNEANLSFPVKGALKTLDVQAGQQVKKGDLLAELDAWDLETDVYLGQYDVQVAEAALSRARAVANVTLERAQDNLSVVQAETNRTRLEWNMTFEDMGRKDNPRPNLDTRRTYARGDAEIALADARVEQAKVAVELAKQYGDPYYSVLVATRELERARARLQRSQERLAVTQSLAPFDGVIVALSVRVGDGLDAYQPIGLIADPSRLTVVANVLETDIYDVSVGQAVTIKLDAYPNRSLSGQVSQIPLRPIAWQGKNAYEVVLAFDDPANLPATVRQGADVSISAQSKPDVLWIPANAIMTKSGQSYVELVQDNGASTLVMVQLGVSDGTRTEVVTYLREGDTVKLP